MRAWATNNDNATDRRERGELLVVGRLAAEAKDRPSPRGDGGHCGPPCTRYHEANDQCDTSTLPTTGQDWLGTAEEKLSLTVLPLTFASETESWGRGHAGWADDNGSLVFRNGPCHQKKKTAKPLPYVSRTQVCPLPSVE